jgi:glycosyltransferase involved in cell wall biosynthesis
MNISVAMTTYNGAAHLREQLQSLATQHLRPTELVIGDDGSTDGTLEILQNFATTAPFPVRIHRNPARLGYRLNFLATASRCTSALISFCDQDDIWLPQNLARIAPCFDDPEVLLAFHNSTIVDASRQPVSPFYAVPFPAASKRLTLSPWLFSYGFTQTFRSALLPAAALFGTTQDHLHPGETMGHDLFFFFLAASLGSVCYIHAPLTEYRLHAGNTFGPGKRTQPGFVDRWRYRLEDRSGTYENFAKVAATDSALLSQLSGLPTLSLVLRQRAAKAAISWRDLASLYADRAKLCAAPLLSRAEAFARLQRRGAYGEAAFWTFGRKAMMKDLALGLVLAPLVQRFGRAASPGDPACRRGRNALAAP